MTFQIATQAPGSSSAPPRPAARIPRPAPGLRPVRARRRAGPHTVLALFDQDCPTSGLQRAVTLARTLDAPLHVLRVLPPARFQGLFSRGSAAVAARMVQRTLSTDRDTRAWLRDSLGTDDVIAGVTIAHGDFVAQTAVYAASIGASLIIIPPGEGKLGKSVKSLACATRMPVFVTRTSVAAAGAIVAATDLRSPDYPVLSGAAEVGRRLQKPVVAVHNVEPRPLSSAEMVWTISAPQPDVALELRSEQLARAAHRLPVESRTVVLHEFGSANAILDQAQASDADLLVIGTRRGNWLHGFTSSVTTQVVNRARCSVLVLPLDASRSAEMTATSPSPSATPAGMRPVW